VSLSTWVSRGCKGLCESLVEPQVVTTILRGRHFPIPVAAMLDEGSEDVSGQEQKGSVRASLSFPLGENQGVNWILNPRYQ
jgi:hypothetical protein